MKTLFEEYGEALLYAVSHLLLLGLFLGVLEMVSSF